MRFEFQRISSYPNATLIERLNVAGADGWDLVANEGRSVLLKRSLVDPTEITEA